ncbi:hypothetical protein TNCV_4015881 [Trichonephila clavipes]|nr:hypothetical protein TNCV_4015881 [Trichonephila clavipes]
MLVPLSFRTLRDPELRHEYVRLKLPMDKKKHNKEKLLNSTPKHSSDPELLRQLTLEVINDIPDQALITYTYGSRSDTGSAGTKSPGLSLQCRGSRAQQTALEPLELSTFRGMNFVQEEQSFFTCSCSLPASPVHLLDP